MRTLLITVNIEAFRKAFFSIPENIKLRLIMINF